MAGGVTTCLTNEYLWRAFSVLIEGTERCSRRVQSDVPVNPLNHPQNKFLQVSNPAGYCDWDMRLDPKKTNRRFEGAPTNLLSLAIFIFCALSPFAKIQY